METATPKNGLRYAYDTAGRLTTLTDYDNAALSYTYDTSGRALTMTDYHNNTTSYTYSNTGRLSTLTAPGNKTWTYTYNGIGQPTQVAIPNGMTTAYTYDNRNRLTKIEHKDGATALDSFAYTLDAQGNITRTTQVDGSYWDYTYDDRYRLATADRYNGSGTIHAHYGYTYDAADNMTSKVEPFLEDFDDGNFSGWNTAGTWSAANGYMQNTVSSSWSWFYRGQPDSGVDVHMSYRLDSGNDRMYLRPRWKFNATTDRMELLVYPTYMVLAQYLNGIYTNLATSGTGSTQGTWYDLRLEADGANVNVWQGPRGGAMTKIMTVTNCTVLQSDALGIFAVENTQWSFDNLRIINSQSTTTTMTYNNANELTSASKDNGTISYTYDGYGRMTGKSQGSYAATYAYRYGDKLTAVSSNFPWEGNVTYEYGGDGKRRIRNDGTVTKHRWNGGWTELEQEDGTGALTMTYIGRFADVPGGNPSSGAYRYYIGDSLISTCELRGQNKSRIGSFEYSPFGETIFESGDAVSRRFAGYTLDLATKMYYLPFRYYSPSLGAWSSRDPLGIAAGANPYNYVSGRPTAGRDPLGLLGPLPAGGGDWDITVGSAGNPWEITWKPSAQQLAQCEGGKFEIEQKAITENNYDLLHHPEWHADPVKFFWDPYKGMMIGSDSPSAGQLGGTQNFADFVYCVQTYTDCEGKKHTSRKRIDSFLWRVVTQINGWQYLYFKGRKIAIPPSTDPDYN